jgi:uncharacterized protein DUF2298
MLLLRVVFFELLICLHVIGAAALFRRFFPRESPWFGFIVPIFLPIAALNFIEHFVALPNLGWLLPITTAGMIWALVKPGFSWDGLRFPSILFIITFSFMLLMRCTRPDVVVYTEGAVDLTRILNYSMGEKVPPIDSWMPPYDSGTYYSFQHYGASLLKRLFSVDIGTAYNLSFALLHALLCLTGAAVAFTITRKKWIAAMTVIILAAGASGSAPILMLLGKPDYALSTSLNTGWDDPSYHNPFSWLCARDPAHPDLTLVTPMYTLYCSEFHANLGATYLTLALVLATYEAFRVGRFFWPWVCLLALPMVIIVTSAWYFIIAAMLTAGGLLLSLAAGRRPQNMAAVLMTASAIIICVWPSFASQSTNLFDESLVINDWKQHTPLWMFLVQFWPVFLPWIALWFIWDRIDPVTRWLQVIVAVAFVLIEFFSLSASDNPRYFIVQKLWGDLYGIALITLLPAVFVQRGPLYRMITVVLCITFTFCLLEWNYVEHYDDIDRGAFAVLTGDHGVKLDKQRARILEVLKNLHGAVVLPGRSNWSYYTAPLVVTLSENRCFVGYTFQESQYGHGGETEYRNKLDNDFYDGQVANPLAFLRAYNIAAVMIWPEDHLSDDILQKITAQIGSDYYYIDCKMDEAPNAGVFLRQTLTPAITPPASASIPATAAAAAPAPPHP